MKKVALEIKEKLNREELINRLLLEAGAPSHLKEILLEKEKKAASFVGHATALPHLETKELEEATIVYAYLHKGVQWGLRPMDSARAILLLLTPERNEMRELMSKVALLLLNKPRGVPLVRGDLDEI